MTIHLIKEVVLNESVLNISCCEESISAQWIAASTAVSETGAGFVPDADAGAAAFGAAASILMSKC